MNARENEPNQLKKRTNVERKSERELVITRIFNGPARIVFEAWTKPELLKLWWAPKSIGVSLLSCEADVRVGGNTVSRSAARAQSLWRSSASISR
jgi:uncharacterized protein YndB with AHSA1/START domain